MVQKESKLVPGLDGQKMSKSYGNHIPMFAEEKKLRKLIMKIKTDSSSPESPKDPNNSLVFDLFKEFATPEQVENLRKRYKKGISWGEAKQTLFEVVNNRLKEPREKYRALINNRGQIDALLKEGGEKARQVARAHLKTIRLAIGIDQ